MANLTYPIGIQSFEKIRTNGFIYIDKTSYIQTLLEQQSQYVFLSRPRRFGKSLFMSTLHEFFAGRKELFEGLAIADYETEWIKHPVLHMELTGADYSLPGSLEAKLNNIFERWEREYGLQKENHPFGERFENIIRKANEVTEQKVVILIDEYDKPLLETVDQPQLQERFRNTLRGVYGNLKGMDGHIRFAMLTGVTKFGHLSIFSDLNNLDDISMDERYAGICGISTDELHRYFKSGVTELADYGNITIDEAFEELRINYDGYHFTPRNPLDMYNPFSVLNALKSRDIDNYWFSTGTPSFLVKLIKTGQLPLKKLEAYKVSLDAVKNVSFDMKSSLIPVLYQSGYLTIRSFNPTTRILTLDYPNREVEKGFLEYLMKVYIPKTEADPAFYIAEFYEDVCEGRINDFMTRLKSFFADFPYDSFDKIKLEQHYQDVTFLVFKLLGFMTNVEYKTATGHIDMVVKTADYIYVFEFKLDKSPEEALEQIDTNNYLLPFTADSRQLIKIGANFSSTTKGLDEWIIEH